MVRRFLIKVLISAVAVYAAAYFVAGFSVLGGLKGVAIVGLVLGLMNAFIRPIIKLLAFPLILLSLGLFTFIINAGILWLVAVATDRVVISGLWPLVWATIVISAVHMLFDPIANHS